MWDFFLNFICSRLILYKLFFVLSAWISNGPLSGYTCKHFCGRYLDFPLFCAYSIIIKLLFPSLNLKSGKYRSVLSGLGDIEAGYKILSRLNCKREPVEGPWRGRGGAVEALISASAAPFPPHLSKTEYKPLTHFIKDTLIRIPSNYSLYKHGGYWAS